MWFYKCTIDVFNMNISNVLEGIIIGGMGGAAACLALWGVQCLREKRKNKVDKETVYKCLKKRTKEYNTHFHDGTGPGWFFISTIDLSICASLPPDRIRYICSVHENIIPMRKHDVAIVFRKEITKEDFEDRWGLREFGNKDFDEK